MITHPFYFICYAGLLLYCMPWLITGKGGAPWYVRLGFGLLLTMIVLGGFVS